MSDIYQSPESQLNKEPPKGNIVKGVVFGSLVDIIGTIVFSVIYGLLYAMHLASQGLSNNEIDEAFAALSLYHPVTLIGLVAGLYISFCAGHMCAKKAGTVQSGKKAASILCVVSCAFGMLLGGGTYSLAENIVLLLLTVVAIQAGAMKHLKDMESGDS